MDPEGRHHEIRELPGAPGIEASTWGVQLWFLASLGRLEDQPGGSPGDMPGNLGCFCGEKLWIPGYVCYIGERDDTCRTDLTYTDGSLDVSGMNIQGYKGPGPMSTCTSEGIWDVYLSRSEQQPASAKANPETPISWES